MLQRIIRFAIFAAIFPLLAVGNLAKAQQIRPPARKDVVAELSSSGPQRRQGDVYIADGDVKITYGDTTLRADHVEYNEKTTETLARGHVVYEFAQEHLEADETHYDVSTGRGHFINVRGTVRIARRPNPDLLISENPLYFEAKEVERLPGDVYLVRQAWITVCDQAHPTWRFFARHAHIQLDKNVALVNANFRLFRVPLIWLPYATAPAGRKVRQSGFLIPDIGDSSRKGFIFGDGFYFAPVSWMDATLAAQYWSRRGVSQRGQIRAKPFENTNILYSYFGVDDRGLRDAAGVRRPQGGEEQQLQIQSELPRGWRFVTDYNQLSSLTFRLAFAETFGDAINSEVRSAAFLTNNFRGYSLNFAGINDESFLTINPQASVTLRNLPRVHFSSVERNPWKRIPVYFAFESFADGARRDDPLISTLRFVSRTEFAPKMTVPLHAGEWLGLTASASFRTTRYGASLENTANGLEVTRDALVRNTGEFAIELRPPTLERFFDRVSSDKKKHRRYKHVIEPEVAYRYITGVNNFADFIRFDADSTLTDTNEIEYGFTQRLYLKNDSDQPSELASWRVVQKHYFDPTFGGAIVPGQRNVFPALNSITPFAFATGPVNWSPIVSDFKMTPGGPYDFEQILEYDPNRQKVTVIGSLVKVKPYRQFFATVADFRLQADPILQPLANQIRALVGYGSETRKGFNFTTGISYDILKNTLQSQVVQASYNGSCCGLALEYRRIALGQVRTENQFRVAFIIANIGNFGNLRRKDRIF